MKVSLAPWQIAAIFSPFDHFAMIAGVGAGKTFSGSHFAINMIKSHPDTTGFIGANSYDQLTQATLRELFHWMTEYKMDYVIDQMPPDSWAAQKRFKSYKNIMSIRNEEGAITHVFIRVLSDPNMLRGVEFSWYWIDESRDTPLNTHDVILSRMRESSWQKGLVTTTPAGEDWVYKRFVRNKDKSNSFGSLHVKTIEAVRAGILSEQYYNTMLKSYSPLMVEQELNAQHVNVAAGRAYYAASEANRKYKSPWGSTHPTQDRPLIIGCDFNFSPAPCVWEVGQLGDLPNGEMGIHWFSEISDIETSSSEMTKRVINMFPGFHYRFFGDASGMRGSTSNQGITDVIHIQETMNDAECSYSIDFDQANPHVKDRVENVCRLLKNGLGDVTMTYNPNNCPHLDADFRVVGWKRTSGSGGIFRGGRLDDGGDCQRTHAADGVGYACFKLFAPAGRVRTVEGISRLNADLL